MSCDVRRGCLNLQTSSLNMLIQTSGLQSCQVRVIILIIEISKLLFATWNIILSDSVTYCVFTLFICSFFIFQNCTVTLKGQSLLSTGRVLRWNSELMVCS